MISWDIPKVKVSSVILTSDLKGVWLIAPFSEYGPTDELMYLIKFAFWNFDRY